MQKKSKIIIGAIIAAIVLVVGVFTAIALTGKVNSIEKEVGEKLSLGQKFLLDLEYDKAVAEFQAVIDIEPKNADAYIGLAEAYIGMGDENKAIEALEKGLAETGDERIQAKIDEMKSKKEMTAVATEQIEEGMTKEELVELNKNFQEYIKKQISAMETDVDFDFSWDFNYDNTMTYLFLLNENSMSETEKLKVINEGLISNDKEELINSLSDAVGEIGYFNGSYPYFAQLFSVSYDNSVVVSVNYDNYISIKEYVIDDSYAEKIDEMDQKVISSGNTICSDLAIQATDSGILSGYELNDESTSIDCIIKLTYDDSVLKYIMLEIDDDTWYKFCDKEDENVEYVVSEFIKEHEDIYGNNKVTTTTTPETTTVAETTAVVTTT